MAITINLPEQIENALRAQWDDLDQAAKEALAIESYRRGKIGLGQVARILGLETRIEAQAWLAKRRVPLNYDLSDLEADRETLGKLFNVKL